MPTSIELATQHYDELNGLVDQAVSNAASLVSTPSADPATIGELASAAADYSQAGIELGQTFYDTIVPNASDAAASLAAQQVTAPESQVGYYLRQAAQGLITADRFLDEYGRMVQDNLFGQARDVVRENVRRTKGMRWMRLTNAGACPFCSMLATRGAVYHSATEAGEYSQYHTRCRCLVIPVREGESVTVPNYYKEYEAEYADARKAGHRTTNDIANYIRRQRYAASNGDPSYSLTAVRPDTPVIRPKTRYVVGDNDSLPLNQSDFELAGGPMVLEAKVDGDPGSYDVPESSPVHGLVVSPDGSGPLVDPVELPVRHEVSAADALRAAQETFRDEGGTFTRAGMVNVKATQGISVGGYAPTVEVKTTDVNVLAAEIRKYAATQGDSVTVGTWWNKETDTVYLDAVKIFDDPKAAIAQAKSHGELAVFDIAKLDEIDTRFKLGVDPTPPKIAIEKAESLQQISDILQGRHPNLPPITGQELVHSRSLENARRVAHSVDDYMDKYPNARITQMVFTNDTMGSKTIARTVFDDDGSTRLEFNGKWYDGTEKNDLRIESAKSAERKGFPMGFHPDGFERDPYYWSTAHEFGHVLDANGNTLKGSGPAFVNIIDTEYAKWAKANPDEFARLTKEFPTDPKDPAKTDLVKQEWLRRNFSGYSFDQKARNSLHKPEALAEAFIDVDLNGDKASPVAQELHSLLVTRYKGGIKDPGTVKPVVTQDVSPALALRRYADTGFGGDVDAAVARLKMYHGMGGEILDPVAKYFPDPKDANSLDSLVDSAKAAKAANVDTPQVDHLKEVPDEWFDTNGYTIDEGRQDLSNSVDEIAEQLENDSYFYDANSEEWRELVYDKVFDFGWQDDEVTGPVTEEALQRIQALKRPVPQWPGPTIDKFPAEEFAYAAGDWMYPNFYAQAPDWRQAAKLIEREGFSRGPNFSYDEGEAKDVAAALLSGIEQSPPTQDFIFRGIHVNKAVAQEITDLSKKDYSMGLSSFSDDEAMAIRFAKDPTDGGWNNDVDVPEDATEAIVFEIEPGARAAYMGGSSESEFITLGDFEKVGLYVDSDGVKHVKLRQRSPIERSSGTGEPQGYEVKMESEFFEPSPKAVGAQAKSVQAFESQIEGDDSPAITKLKAEVAQAKAIVDKNKKSGDPFSASAVKAAEKYFAKKALLEKKLGGSPNVPTKPKKSATKSAETPVAEPDPFAKFDYLPGKEPLPYNPPKSSLAGGRNMNAEAVKRYKAEYVKRLGPPVYNSGEFEGMTHHEMWDMALEDRKKYGPTRDRNRTAKDQNIADAFENYGGSAYAEMNELLRGEGTSGYSPEEIAATAKEVKLMIGAMHPVGKDIVVHRMSRSETLDKVRAGDQFRDPGFSSTTVQPGYMDEVHEQLYQSDPDAITMVIRVPKEAEGMYITALQNRRGRDYDTGESELLLQAGTEFKVISRKGKNLVLEVIPPGAEGSTENPLTTKALNARVKQYMKEAEDE